MAGSKIGGKKASETIRAKDPDFYKRIGAKGGRASNVGGFGDGEAGKERARIAGKKGGLKSRRPKNPQKAKAYDLYNEENLRNEDW